MTICTLQHSTRRLWTNAAAQKKVDHGHGKREQENLLFATGFVLKCSMQIARENCTVKVPPNTGMVRRTKITNLRQGAFA